MKCALCGYVFDEGDTSRCTQCPFNQGCRIICCPNCGYEMPPETRMVQWLKRLTGKKAPKKETRHV